MCNLQLEAYTKRFNVGYLAPQAEKEKFDREDYQRTRDINSKLKELTQGIRTYLIESEVLPGKKNIKKDTQ